MNPGSRTWYIGAEWRIDCQSKDFRKFGYSRRIGPFILLRRAWSGRLFNARRVREVRPGIFFYGEGRRGIR
jgi:hypothetical protein